MKSPDSDPTLDAFHLAHDERTFTVFVGIDDLATLGFTHLLHNNLLRGLRRDTTEFDRLDLLLDKIAELDFGIIDLGRFQRNLAQRFFETTVFGRFDHFPATIGIVFAGFTVDIDPHLDVLLVFLARCRRERGLDRLENDFAIHALLVGDGICDQQDFFIVHRHYS